MVVLAPAVLLALLGISSLIDRPLSEQWIGRVVPATIATGLCAAVTILVLMLSLDRRFVPIQLGNWVDIPHYHFVVKFVFDRLSVPFVILSFVLCGTIGAFANRYMHREPGFNRFFVLFSLFVVGMVTTSLAGTIETLFAGWEMVGLSSALLVAFFHERPAPVQNGLRVWSVYRVSDAALLLAAVVLHHLTGEAISRSSWAVASGPRDTPRSTRRRRWSSGCCCWSPPPASRRWCRSRAGCRERWKGRRRPAPCSTAPCRSTSAPSCCCGSVPSWIASWPLSIIVVVVGLSTALFAGLAEKLQTDIKSALSFASLSQVGIIVAEIGLGLRYIALDPSAGTRLPAHAAIRASADDAAGCPFHGERDWRDCPIPTPTRRAASGDDSEAGSIASPWNAATSTPCSIAGSSSPSSRSFAGATPPNDAGPISWHECIPANPTISSRP